MPENIYQAIWDADQESNGIQPVLKASEGNATRGFLVVNEVKQGDADHILFPQVVIPSHKKRTYDLCERLFNNYTLDKTKRENPTSQEAEEENYFLEAIVDTPPMIVARNWLTQRTNQTFSSSRWYQILREIWFERFDLSSGKDLTGFEHVIVGEQRQGKVSGYHFWYKYYLDDQNNLRDEDGIHYQGTRGDNQEGNIMVPEVSTIAFRWEAFDYERKVRRPLYKKIGGFFNGCSIEGLMAIGTLRFFLEGYAPKEAIINGASYNLKIFRSNNAKHLVTFYPVFGKIVEPIDNGGEDDHREEEDKGDIASGSIKIIAALVNPKGHDPGFEKVLIINISPEEIELKDCRIQDKNGNTYDIPNQSLAPTENHWITLPAETAQLSNKGGSIALMDKKDTVIHKVLYTKDQASRQGATLLF